MKQPIVQFKIESKDKGDHLIPLIETILNKIGMQNTLISAMKLQNHTKVKVLFKNEYLELLSNYPHLNKKYDFAENEHEIILFKAPIPDFPDNAIRVFSVQFNDF